MVLRCLLRCRCSAAVATFPPDTPPATVAADVVLRSRKEFTVRLLCAVAADDFLQGVVTGAGQSIAEWAIAHAAVRAARVEVDREHAVQVSALQSRMQVGALCARVPVRGQCLRAACGCVTLLCDTVV